LGIKALLEIVEVLPDKKIQNLNLSKNSIYIKKPDYPSVKPTESEL